MWVFSEYSAGLSPTKIPSATVRSTLVLMVPSPKRAQVSSPSPKTITSTKTKIPFSTTLVRTTSVPILNPLLKSTSVPVSFATQTLAVNLVSPSTLAPVQNITKLFEEKSNFNETISVFDPSWWHSLNLFWVYFGVSCFGGFILLISVIVCVVKCHCRCPKSNRSWYVIEHANKNLVANPGHITYIPGSQYYGPHIFQTLPFNVNESDSSEQIELFSVAQHVPQIPSRAEYVNIPLHSSFSSHGNPPSIPTRTDSRLSHQRNSSLSAATFPCYSNIDDRVRQLATEIYLDVTQLSRTTSPNLSDEEISL
jgi:hypothetical protein